MRLQEGLRTVIEITVPCRLFMSPAAGQGSQPDHAALPGRHRVTAGSRKEPAAFVLERWKDRSSSMFPDRKRERSSSRVRARLSTATPGQPCPVPRISRLMGAVGLRGRLTRPTSRDSSWPRGATSARASTTPAWTPCSSPSRSPGEGHSCVTPGACTGRTRERSDRASSTTSIARSPCSPGCSRGGGRARGRSATARQPASVRPFFRATAVTSLAIETAIHLNHTSGRSRSA